MKGNIKIEESHRDTETVGERGVPQIRVTINYSIEGIDLSEGLKEPVGEKEQDDFYADMDERTDQVQRDLRNYFNNLFSKPGVDATQYPDLVNQPNFVGLHADVSLYTPEKFEDLKNVHGDIEVHAFYDVPVSSLETVIEKATKDLAAQFGKKQA